MKEILSRSKKDTKKIAHSIGQHISYGDVLALVGDLGGGKTTFTKFLAKTLGIKERVTSPTFNLIKEYSFGEGKMYHLDLYRVNDEIDAENLGLSEILADKKGIVVIEWADKIRRILPKHTRFIEFDFIDKNTRRIIIR